MEKNYVTPLSLRDTIRQIGDWRSNAYQKYIFPTSDSLKVAMTAVVNPLRSTYPYS